MQKIVPHLWFDKEAKEAAAFYAKTFTDIFGGDDSKVTSVSQLHDTPSGDADVLAFTVRGYEFAAISAGPYFRINPSISFLLNFDPSVDPDATEHLDALWAALADGGKPLMPLEQYPFSDRYGWIQDKFGVSWQLMRTDPKGEPRPFLTPAMLFVGGVSGKAEAASDFYLSVFDGAKRGALARYPAGMDPEKEGTIMFTDFTLAGQWFAAMDSAASHDFAFNEAVSFMVRCKDQAEIDRYWAALSAVPEAEQCGWLKDTFGVSWQIVPEAMDDMMRGDKETVARVTRAFLKMKKFDLAELERAARGE